MCLVAFPKFHYLDTGIRISMDLETIGPGVPIWPSRCRKLSTDSSKLEGIKPNYCAIAGLTLKLL